MQSSRLRKRLSLPGTWPCKGGSKTSGDVDHEGLPISLGYPNLPGYPLQCDPFYLRSRYPYFSGVNAA